MSTNPTTISSSRSHLTDICYSPNGSHYVVCNKLGFIYIYDSTNDRIQHTIQCTDVPSCAIVQNNSLLVATSQYLQIHSFPYENKQHSFIQFNHSISSVCLSQSKLFVGTRNGELLMIDLNDDTKGKTNFFGHQAAILSICANDETNLLGTSSIDGFIHIYNINEQTLIKQLDLVEKSIDIDHAKSLVQLAWDTLENLLAIPVKSYVFFYETNSWKLERVYEDNGNKEYIDMIKYSPSKNYFIVTYHHRKLCFIDRITHHVYMIYLPTDVISALQWNPIQSSIVTCTTKRNDIIHLHIMSVDQQEHFSFKTIIGFNPDCIKDKYLYLMAYVLFYLDNKNITLLKDKNFTLDLYGSKYSAYRFSIEKNNCKLEFEMMLRQKQLLINATCFAQNFVFQTHIDIDSNIYGDDNNPFRFTNLINLKRSLKKKFERVFNFCRENQGYNDGQLHIILHEDRIIPTANAEPHLDDNTYSVARTPTLIPEHDHE